MSAAASLSFAGSIDSIGSLEALSSSSCVRIPPFSLQITSPLELVELKGHPQEGAMS